MRLAGRGALLLLPLLALGCFARQPVTRVADGETLAGRPIDADAYAAYLRAAVLDARGDTAGALSELERALDDDPTSPEIQARIAGLRCRLGRGAPTESEVAVRAFERALDRDPRYAPAWLGLAECRERTGDLAGALEAARASAYYDPLDPRPTRATARLLFALGRPSEAFTWLEALATLEPDSLDAQRALLAEASAHHDAAREHRARDALRALGALDAPARRAELDGALARHALAEARSLAVALRLAPSALALRALAVAPELALEQARLVLAADPSDSDAWIVTLVAADLLGDEARFADALPALDPEPLAPSPEALRLFGELLARRAGTDAEQAFGLQRKP